MLFYALTLLQERAFKLAAGLGPGDEWGAVPLLLHYRFFVHVNTPFIIEVSTAFRLKSVS